MSDTNKLRQRIADELNRQSSDIISSPSLSVGLIVNREINAAIAHYETTRFRWNEVREAALATTVSGTRIYSLTANFLSMDSLKVVYSGGYTSLTKRTYEYIENEDRRVSGSTGVPQDYVIYGNVLRLYPVPNGAYSLVASYIRRFPPTSLTPSYCAAIPMGGSSTLTPTTSASHNNRLNGWTTDGEELIRERAKAGCRIRYFYEEAALLEMASLQSAREPYLSVGEKIAFERLAAETNAALATGKIQPYGI